jgi:hypothetical protein
MFDSEELQALAFGAEVTKAWGDEWFIPSAIGRPLDDYFALMDD